MVFPHTTMDQERAVQPPRESSGIGSATCSRRSGIAAGLLVTALLAVPSANAGAPVIDITAIIGDIRAWIDDTVQYAKEAERWKEVKAQIDEASAIFDPLRFSMGLPPGAALQTVAPNYLVVEACGKGAGRLRMERAVGALRFSTREEREAQQLQICVNIQMMQNRKFNETVIFLDRTIKETENAMDAIFRAREDSGNTTGGVQATDSDSARLSNQLGLMAQQWSTRMQGYDAYITVMQSRQNIIARAALQGDPTAEAASDVVKTAVLKAALLAE